MDINVQSVAPFQHQRRLYYQITRRFRFIRLHGHGLFRHLFTYLRKRSCGVSKLISVIITRHTKSRIIMRQIELSQFLIDNELIQSRLFGKLITKSQTIIKETKTYIQRAPAETLFQGKQHFVIMVTDKRLLTPYRFPRFVQ